MVKYRVPIGQERIFNRPGMPVSKTVANCYVVDTYKVIDLLSSPDLFFEMNPMFSSLEKPVKEALSQLHRQGIIGTDKKPARKGGCSGCKRRKLFSIIIRLVSGFQKRLMSVCLKGDKVAATRIRQDLREYLRARYPDGGFDTRRILFYGRTSTGVKEIEI